MRIRLTIAAALGLLLIASACGNRLPEAELLAAAAAGGAAPVATTMPGADTTTTSTRGTQAPTTGGATTTGPSDTVAEGPAAAPAGAVGVASATCTRPLAPIVIGSVSSLSGIFGAIFRPGVQAVQAWVAATNAKGGIKCHPIKYVTADDASDPSTHQALVRRFVEEEKVIAFVQVAAPLSSNASVDYLTSRRIPVIGSETGSPWFYDSPMYFPQVTSGSYLLESAAALVAQYGRSQGKRKYGQVSCIEVQQCSGLHDEIEGYGRKYDFDVVYNGQVTLTQTDFTSNCQAAQQAGAEMFTMGVDTNSDLRLLKNCKSIGFKPIFVTAGILATPALALDANAEGVFVVLQTLPPFRTDVPAMKELADVLRRYAPGVVLDTGPVPGWVSAKMFELAAQEVGATPTSQDILNGLWKIKDNDFGGLGAPVTFTKNAKAKPVLCGWAVKIHNRGYVDVGDGKRKCF